MNNIPTDTPMDTPTDMVMVTDMDMDTTMELKTEKLTLTKWKLPNHVSRDRLTVFLLNNLSANFAYSVHVTLSIFFFFSFDASTPGVLDSLNKVTSNLAQVLKDDLKWDEERWSQASVMDFGCAVGLLAEKLAPKVKHVTGVDISANMIQLFNKRMDESGIKNASSLCHQVKDEANTAAALGRFDLITCSFVLHHLEDTAMFIRTFTSLLKPGGVVAIFDASVDPGSDGLQFENVSQKEDYGVYHEGFTKASLKSHLENSGLRVAHLSEDFTFNWGKSDGPETEILCAYAEKPSQ